MPRSNASAPRRRLEGWRAAIHDYVERVNRAELEGGIAPLVDAVADEEHLRRLEQRLLRTARRDRERAIAPLRSEARAAIERAHESAREASVLLRLHFTKQCRHGGTSYNEQRGELERIRLQQRERVWRIVMIEPVVAERRPRFGIGAETEASRKAEVASTAQQEPPAPMHAPYLSPALLDHYRPGGRSFRSYRRELAVSYADRWWDAPNPEYEAFDVNCTNYVSQCLFAGNAPMDYTGRREAGWWYRGRHNGREAWSYSWSVSNALKQLLAAPRTSGLRAQLVENPAQLALGDIIVYDWNGDDRFQHSTIVTAFDASGMPLVNANTVASRHRYWDYRDSYAWTERTSYRFFHIADLL
ncbi:amidase domain-containing protein [Paenibacillus sp. IB182496]|uniref:Amidase domain-containing protein n=1 Tax=Paenibacillus sabuli TaxID=2772509 RepID=A0A927GV41_9BACL|nr:amidase domain-containing protein [Paenibacillus sabuli]MBD2848357.1 amidase domain-containing protein [Paenibacillus sabuli]